MKVFGDISRLWTLFINVSVEFENIFSFKQLILYSVTVISIFQMSMFFNSEILSNLLIQPLVIIDTLDDLVQFSKQNQDVKIISDNLTTTWSLMKNWNDERAKFIYKLMVNEQVKKFDYNQVYNGKSIVISFDTNFQRILNTNPDLSFHMSADRMFGYQFGFLYSKFIDVQTKRFIDSMISSLFESGIHKFLEDRKYSKRLHIEDGDLFQAFSFDYFKKVIYIYCYILFSLPCIFIIEYLVYLYFK